jgi:hypothetical protein
MTLEGWSLLHELSKVSTSHENRWKLTIDDQSRIGVVSQKPKGFGLCDILSASRRLL